MSLAGHAILANWEFPLWLTCSLLTFASVYLRGWLAMRRTRRAQFGILRLASFLGGLLVLWIAIGSPLDGFADVLLSAHMVEHLLLMSVVPPLILFGVPLVPLLRGLPRHILASVVAPLIRIASLRRVAEWLVTPVVAWLAMNLVFLGWHIPAAYDFALEHEAWHAVEHLCFLSSSLLFWWAVLRPWPARVGRRSWSILFYLLAADIVNTMLSAFLAFCGHPVYGFYSRHPNPLGVAPYGDQTMGAAIMWVMGSIAFLVPSVMILFRNLGQGSQTLVSDFVDAEEPRG